MSAVASAFLFIYRLLRAPVDRPNGFQVEWGGSHGQTLLYEVQLVHDLGLNA